MENCLKDRLFRRVGKLFILIGLISVVGCSGGGNCNSGTANEITAFLLMSPGGIAVNGVISGENIAVTMPSDTNAESLIATFTTSGSFVKVNGIVQTSGVTVNNFSTPVDYSVYAQDGSTKVYTVTVTVRTSKAYFANAGADSYTQCNIGTSGIESSSCLEIKPSGAGSLSGPTGMAFNDKYAYFLNSTTNSYTQCLIGESEIESGSCLTVTPGAPGELYIPLGLAFRGNQVYIVNSFNSTTSQATYTQCSVDGNGIVASSCNTIDASTYFYDVWGVYFSQDYVYFPSSSNNGYVRCDMNGSNINAASCISPSLPTQFSAPRNMTAKNGFAYFSNSGGGYTQCNISALGVIDDVSCQQSFFNVPDPGALGTNGIAQAADFIYFTNSQANSYTQCSINSNEIDTNSCITVDMTGKLTMPWGIVVISIPAL